MSALKLRAGPETLNGPILEGFSTLLSMDGVQVLVTAPTQGDLIAAVLCMHTALDARVVGMQGGVQTRTAQPPWYQNETKPAGLDDLFKEQAPRRRRATLGGAS